MSIRENALTKLSEKWSPIGHPDRISGALLVIVACITIFEASGLPFGSLRKPDAGFFPLSLSTLLLIFAIGIVINSFRSKPEQTDFSSRSWYVMIAALAFIIYAVSLEKVGFVMGTTAIMLLMSRGLGGMRWTLALTIAIPSTLISYFAFVQLGVPLPRGPLPF
jgi:hypothetical protein